MIGVSGADGRVLRALGTPLIGQFDPAFTSIMDEVAELGRRAFQTASARCVPVSGRPAAALEAVLNTFLEPGQRVVALGGIAEGVADMAERYGATVEITTGETLAASLNREGARLVVVEHVEGLAELAQVCHTYGAWLLVEASLSLGGRELRFDAWGLDAAVAGLDRCLGGPAGLSLTVYSAEIEAAFQARQQPPPTSYLDLVQLQAYWSPERLNHHTAPTSLVYAAREALRLALVEGLEERWQRHHQIEAGLQAGLAALGVSEPLDDDLARLLRDEYGIALGPGGELRLVAENARRETLLVVLASLEQALLALGRTITPGAARTAALRTV